MLSNPRRVGKIEVEVTLPETGSENEREILEKTGDNCPVIKSIHPEIELVISYDWNLPNSQAREIKSNLQV